MLITETITIDNTQFMRTYSDAGKLIMQLESGGVYEEAVDPMGVTRSYLETEVDIPREAENEEAAEAEEGSDAQ